MLVRRLITVPTFITATLAVTALLPILLLLALPLRFVPATRGVLATLLFVTGYLWCETIGITVAAAIWLRHRRRSAYVAANYRLQRWWANALKVLAERLFRLQFEVTGHDALEGPAALMLPRHASIADTIIPMVFYAIPCNVRLRYVLKNELLVDPCLDIVGHRLPNLFVDRSGQDSERARQGVSNLMKDLGPDEGVLIYPEGTRFSHAKRAALQERYRDSADMAEGSSHFSNLVNGSWMGAHIRIHFWRVPFAQIPTARDALVRFLFGEWDRMQNTVRALADGRPAPEATTVSART